MSLKKTAAAVLLVAFCLNVSPTRAMEPATVTLVRGGEPAACIVTAEHPTSSAHLAALELQYHIQKITGAVLPIETDRMETTCTRILVGESQLTRVLGITTDDFEPLEYLIQIRPDAIVLIGRDRHDTPENLAELGRSTYRDTLASYRHTIDYHTATGQSHQGPKPITLPGLFDDQGTCYATYDFLERYCDVRWYGPTELNIVLPSQTTLTVSGGTIRRSRDLKHVHATGGSWPIISVQWNHPNADELNLYWRRLRVGGEKWAGNHTIHRATVKSIFNDPVYQAKGRGQGGQVCYTNPELIQKVAQVARDYFDGKGLPEGLKAMGDYFAVVPDDNASWCQCDRCQQMLTVSRADKRGHGFFSNASSSYYIFSFINEVARELRKTHPDKYIATLAYASYAYPPRNRQQEDCDCPTGRQGLCQTGQNEFRRQGFAAKRRRLRQRPPAAQQGGTGDSNAGCQGNTGDLAFVYDGRLSGRLGDASLVDDLDFQPEAVRLIWHCTASPSKRTGNNESRNRARRVFEIAAGRSVAGLVHASNTSTAPVPFRCWKSSPKALT